MIELDRLVQLAVGDLDDAEAATVEEHVFACGACASTLERLLQIGGGVRELVQAGRLDFPISDALLAELTKAGLVSRSYRLAPDHVVPCAVGTDDVFAVLTLEADLRAVERVDVVQTMLGKAHRIADVPFDAERGLVRLAARAETLRTFPTTRIHVELFALDRSGAPNERRLSEYFLDHTAYTPER